MTKLMYAQQLAHPKWQRRRLDMLKAAGRACTTCGETDRQLHVHHRAYFKGRMAWEYADPELAVLCSICHGKEHEAKELIDQLLLAIPHHDEPIKRALALLSGYFGADTDQAFDVSLRVGRDQNSIEGGMAGCIAATLTGLPQNRYLDVMNFINQLREKEGLDER